MPPDTRQGQRLIETAVAILTDAPTSDDFAFHARQLVQATLPHTDPAKKKKRKDQTDAEAGQNAGVFMRQEGNARLMIRQGYNIKTGKPLGLPYGTIPRLLLYWITTEAVRTRSRTLKLGSSLNEFMRALNLEPATGRGERGDAKRVRDQMHRLFSAAITFGDVAQDEHGGEGFRQIDMPVATRQQYWWSLSKPNQASLWENEITLGEDFFDAVTAAPIPLDIRALKGLKRSPLALDLYAWCAYNAFRAQQTGKSRWVTWEKLALAMGADYATAKEFSRKARKELVKVKAVFPGLQLGSKRGCLEVLPTSTPPVLPRPVVENP